MISVDPTSRHTFEDLLLSARDTTFPESFYAFLHHYVSSINEISSPSVFPRAVAPAQGAIPDPLNGAGVPGQLPASDSDHRIERIWAEFDTVEPYLAAENSEETITERKPDYTAHEGVTKAVQVCQLPAVFCFYRCTWKLTLLVGRVPC